MKSRTIPLFIVSVIWSSLNLIDLECKNEKEVTAWCKVLVFLYDNKEIITLFLIGFLFVYNYFLYVKQRKNVQEIVKSFFVIFFKENLNHDKENHRLTLFETKRGISIFIPYLFNTFVRCVHYWNSDKFLIRLQKTPWPVPWVKYLVVHSRVGWPNENYRVTTFKIPKSNLNIDCFAAHVYHQCQIRQVKLHKIEHIELKKISNLKALSMTNSNKVKGYMNKSHIRKFSTLKLLGRRPIYLGGVPLMIKGEAETTSHVIMYDSNNIPFENIKSELTALGKNIAIILKNS